MKIQKLATTGILVTALLGAVSSISVSADDFVGEPSADVQVNGTIGFDNTLDPGTPPTDPDEMINVTMPISVAFASTKSSNHHDIEAANYTIQNKSAWAVDVAIENLTNESGLQVIDDLKLQTSGNAITLITAGASVVNSEKLVTLEGNKGTTTSIDYTFVGSATPTKQEEKPGFTMVMKFEAINPNP